MIITFKDGSVWHVSPWLCVMAAAVFAFAGMITEMMMALALGHLSRILYAIKKQGERDAA